MKSWISLVALVLLAAAVQAQDAAAKKKCETEDDLDYETCQLEHLSKEALIAICDRMELDVEKEIFPFILEDLEENKDNTEDYEPGQVEKEIQHVKDRDHTAYVAAAYECLMVEDHLDDEEGAEFNDPFVISQIVEEMIANEPEAIAKMERELKEQNTDLWKEISKEFKEGDTLIKRPDLIGEIVGAMVKHPRMLMNMGEDDDDDDDDDLEEDL